MTDWESWLRDAAKRPSDHENRKRQLTEEQVSDALSEYEPLAGRDYIVYTKGSYKNNTNVRLNYDVDIAVEYRGYFYFDFILGAENYGPTDAGINAPSSDTYARNDFKRDIRGALESAFGKSAVTAGDIALRVREETMTLPADVVPCWEYRRYDRLLAGRPAYSEGSRVYPASGGHKDNFPEKQYTNGVAKNDRTHRRYKRMVRAFKKLQTRLVQDGLLDEELASYFSECLAYNVPDIAFGHTNYVNDMNQILARIFNSTLDAGDYAEWEQVHGLEYLFHGPFERSVAHHVADVAWDAMGFE